jgi:hypothetical protein
MADHYMPKGERDREGWLSNFSTELQVCGPGLGVSPATITSVENDYLAYKFMLDTEDFFKAKMHERTQYKDTLFNGAIGTVIATYPASPVLPASPVQVAAGIMHRVENLVQVIKGSTGYTEAIGQALKIIVPGKTPGNLTPLEKTVLKPTGKVVENTSTEIKIKWTKGDTDGVIVYVNAAATAAPAAGAKVDAEAAINWVEYGRYNFSPFVDTRKNAGTQPETRMYKLQYFEKDKPVGVQSDIIKVVAAIY